MLDSDVCSFQFTLATWSCGCVEKTREMTEKDGFFSMQYGMQFRMQFRMRTSVSKVCIKHLHALKIERKKSVNGKK